jgi:hypothetical protein
VLMLEIHFLITAMCFHSILRVHNKCFEGRNKSNGINSAKSESRIIYFSKAELLGPI